MVSIAQDAKFMKSLLAANPVPVGRVVAIKDQESNPGVVSLGQDSKLNLTIKIYGKLRLVDLGSMFGLSGNVQASDIHQDTDLKLWFVVATEIGVDKSNDYLVANLTPQELLSPPRASIIKSPDSYSRVHSISMV